MLIHHNALILVADGRKYLLLRNHGTPAEPRLAFEGGGEKTNPRTRDQGTDQPGRAFASVGGARSAVEQTDFHQLEEDRFAADVAGMLGQLARAGDFEELIVVAPPRTLAELRGNYDRAVAGKVVAEVDKDLTRHPVPDITAILSEG